MRNKRFIFSWTIFLVGILLNSCDSSVKENESGSDDTTKTLINAIAIPEEFRKEWTQMYPEDGKYYEPCNPTLILFRQDPESGDWQLLQSDLLSAQSPKKIVSTRIEMNRLTLYTLGYAGDTVIVVLERKSSVAGIADISFYSSAEEHRENKRTILTLYARGEFKEILLPPSEECDFGDQPEVFIDSSYVVGNTFCHLPTGEEETMKLQFKLTCQKDGTLSGTANYDAGVGLAQFSRGTWQMEGQGVSFNIITAGQFPANEDSLMEYSRTISIGSFYELQAYKQCK